MRLIATIPQEDSHLNPYEFSYYLTSQGIHNECEDVPSGTGNITSWRIWVQDEDQVPKALSLLEEYRNNPKDPRYRAHNLDAIRLHEEKLLSPAENTPKEDLDEPNEEKPRTRVLSPAPYGPATIFILLIVGALFIWSQMQKGEIIPPKIEGVIQAPLFPPIEKKLLFDYPAYFQLRDKLFSLYTIQDIKDKKTPPPEARSLIQELQKTPVWMGIYDRVVAYFTKTSDSLAFSGPLFEKIRQGEVWRLFTPALLHYNFLHILFNVLWFILLGNQIEYRIGLVRYLFLILATAVVSNTAQYLMSGPFFLGLSGVVVGLAGFIFARQQVAPWEGYLLQRFTLVFLAIFVIGMFFLQLAFFFMQIFGKFELTIGIANTAHLVGGMVGYLLGRMRLFSLKHHP